MFLIKSKVHAPGADATDMLWGGTSKPSGPNCDSFACKSSHCCRHVQLNSFVNCVVRLCGDTVGGVAAY